jgi:hypothetical protein
MQKFYTLTALLIIGVTSFGQQRLIEYKTIVETEVQKHFEFPLTRSKCTVDSKIDVDSVEALFTNDYVVEENDKESFNNITLKYSVFSDEINDWFSILITINNNKVIDYTKTDFSIIPSCISKNRGCKFIKSDSAISIAIKDSILYPNNLKTYFWVDEKTGKCFWTVRGNPKVKSSRASKNQNRTIDALTGEIIRQLNTSS